LTLTLAVEQLANHNAVMSGHVTDPGAASESVTFSGVVSGQVACNQYGDYIVSLPASGLGTVNAFATDNLNQTSSVVSGQLTNAAPSLTLNYTWGPNKTVTLWGTVTDEAPQSALVLFSGAATGSVTPNPDGTYRVTLPASKLGLVTATVIDQYGAASLATAVTLTDPTPVVSNFKAVQQTDGSWIISGTVTAGFAPGLVVQLGGASQLDNATATVQSDGTFTYHVSLSPGQNDSLTAVTTDLWGAQSNTATTTVLT
jgi:hypothetical protein